MSSDVIRNICCVHIKIIIVFTLISGVSLLLLFSFISLVHLIPSPHPTSEALLVRVGRVGGHVVASPTIRDLGGPTTQVTTKGGPQEELGRILSSDEAISSPKLPNLPYLGKRHSGAVSKFGSSIRWSWSSPLAPKFATKDYALVQIVHCGGGYTHTDRGVWKVDVNFL